MQSSIKADEVEISLFNLRIQWQDYTNTPPPTPPSTPCPIQPHFIENTTCNHLAHLCPQTGRCARPTTFDVARGRAQTKARRAERKSYTQNKVEWNKTKMWKKAKAQKKQATHTHTQNPSRKCVGVVGQHICTFVHISASLSWAKSKARRSRRWRCRAGAGAEATSVANWAPSAPTLRPRGLG